MVYLLDSKSTSPSSLVGGKAFNLSILKNKGYNVPNFFVISTEVYSIYKKEGKVPKDIQKQIYSYFNKLGAREVSVRSSATVEDSQDNSFAGQFDTFLHVNKSNLIRSIIECFKSVSGERVKEYCKLKKIDITKVKLAVVVQKMINSEVSGVAFSKNPINGKNQIIIEGGFGLGEGIVSGRITPDNYIVSNNKIINKSVSNQKERLDKSWKPLSEKDGTKQKLPDKIILELAEIIGQIEKHNGYSVDVEWAYSSGKLYILQSRAITTIRNKISDTKDKSNKYYDSIEFWARLKTSPLFGLTDKERHPKMISNLYVYKNNETHFYFIDNSSEKLANYYFEYFSKKINVKKFINDANILMKKVNDFHKKSKAINWSKLSEKELFERFKEVRKLFNEFYNLYSMSEEVCLNKFNITKNKVILATIGKTRLKLASMKPKFWPILISKVIYNLSKKRKLSLQDTFYYTYDELLSLFKGKKVAKEIISNRKKGCILIIKNNTLNIVTGNEFKRIWEKITYQFRLKDKNIIIGSSAYSGKVKGKVKVVFWKTNMSRVLSTFKKGEILVTASTTPEMVLICKKSAAIITDEGGMASHAAIVSRELKIPCIVGTKVATQVLKTGDVVEVDATRGVVRLLSTNKKN